MEKYIKGLCSKRRLCLALAIVLAVRLISDMNAFIRMHGHDKMLGKILDFICTRLRSTEIALDSLSLVQYVFCRPKTRANKIPYFTKHFRITYYNKYSK